LDQVEIAAYVSLGFVLLVIVWRASGGRLYVLLTVWWAAVITLTAVRGGWFAGPQYILSLLLAPVAACSCG
jgi:hypothetical protein